MESCKVTKNGYALRVKSYKIEKILCARRGREKKRKKKGKEKRKRNVIIVMVAEKISPHRAQNKAEGTAGHRPAVVEAKFCAFTMRYAFKKHPLCARISMKNGNFPPMQLYRI